MAFAGLPNKKIVKPQNTQGIGVYGTQYYQGQGQNQPVVSTAPPKTTLPTSVPVISTPIAQGAGKTVAPPKPLNTDSTLLSDLAGIGVEGQNAFASEALDYGYNKKGAAQSLAQSLASSGLSLSQAKASTAQEKAQAKHSLSQTLAQLAFEKPQDIRGANQTAHGQGLAFSSALSQQLGDINKSYSMRESNAKTDYNDRVSALDLALKQLAERVKQEQANQQQNYNLDWGSEGYQTAKHKQTMEQLTGQYGAPDASGKYQAPQFDPATGTYKGGGTAAQAAIAAAIGRAQQDAIDHPPAVIDPAAQNPTTTSAAHNAAAAIAAKNAANAATSSGPIRVVQGHDSKGNPGVWHYYANRPPVFIRK